MTDHKASGYNGATSTPNIRVLSLGAGVQSTTLLLMACTGVLPRLNAAIFADTRGEPAYVYDHFAKLKAYAADRSTPVRLISAGSLSDTLTEPGTRFTSIPYFTKGSDGKKGIGTRECTREFKVEPINREVRRMLGAKGRGRVRQGVYAEQWIGFSTDEYMRVSEKHQVEHIKQRFPLLELGMSRDDCHAWLEAHGWSDVAKSACVFCPYRSDAEWRFLRDNHPADWKQATILDEAIRKGGVGKTGKTLDGEAFLHASRVPLSLAVIDNDDNKGDPDGCSPYGCRSGKTV